MPGVNIRRGILPQIYPEQDPEQALGIPPFPMPRPHFLSTRFLVLLGLTAWVFVVPIPHTVTLRLAIMAALMLATVVSWPVLVRRLWHSDLRSTMVALTLLTLWILLGNTFWSFHPDASWREFFGDWIRFLLLLLLGVAVVERIDGKQGHAVALALLALVAHWLWLIGYEAWLAITHAPVILGRTPFAERDFHSTLTTFGVTLLIGDALARRMDAKALLPWRQGISWALLAMGLVVTVLLKTRNGTTTVALMAMIASLYWASRYFVNRRQSFTLGAIATVIAAALMATSVATDDRWQGFSEAVGFALDTEGHRYWLTDDDHPPPALPTLPSGRAVEESAYMRVAWIKVSIQLIGEQPWGVGFTHRPFGWAVERHYGLGGNMGTSHSGLLDFALANGIPGLLLWLVASALFMKVGLARYRQEGSGAGLALALFVFGNLVRCAVDGHTSGWRLELFGLVVGLLIWVPSKKMEGPKAA